MGKKTWSLKKVGAGIRKDQIWPWRKWKPIDFQLKIIDYLVYKILYVVEAIVLVSTLCFFSLCCGCHI